MGQKKKRNIGIRGMDFLILYDKKSREIESVCLLKAELEKRGYTVRLSYITDCFRKRLKPRVLITPNLYSNNEVYLRAYGFCKRIDKIVNLQWEQIVCKKYEDDSHAWWRPHQEAQKAIHICWGFNTQQKLINAGVAATNAKVTGRMDLDILTRLDLLIGKDELASKYGLNKDKKWVLFISSFPYAVYSEAVLSNIKGSTGMDVDELTKVSKTNREIILKWLLHACEIYDYEFIYRPHPAEECNDIQGAGMYNNFHVICGESIKHWIYNADRVYNWRSTSAIESILLNRGNVLLRPDEYPLPEQEDFSVFDHAERIGKEEGFIKDLGDFRPVVSNDLLQDYYFRDDKCAAFERVADVCEEVLKGEFSCNIDYKEVRRSLGIRLRIKLYIVHCFGIPFFEKHSKLLELLTRINILKGGLVYAIEMRKRDLISNEEMRETEMYLGISG